VTPLQLLRFRRLAAASRRKRNAVGETDDDSLGNGWLDEAFAWALCLREDLSAETVASFDAWLTSAPAAAEAWREVSRLWTLAGVALATEPAPAVRPRGGRGRGEGR